MSHADDIESQAAEWLARLDAASSGADDNLEFRSWLAADPRHRAAYLRLRAAWEHTAALSRLRPAGSVVDPDLLAPRRSWSAFGMSPAALMVGVAFAVIAIGAFLFMRSARDVQAYRTDVGGMSRIVLGDGSSVTMNTDTVLRVRLGPTRRELALVRGEARFAVAHDSHRPFEVAAGDRIVRAVGTEFDVRCDGSGRSVEVMVTQGRVAMEPVYGAVSGGSAGIATISAGERAIAQGGSVTVRPVSPTEVSRRLAWETGELSFQGETLKEAVAEFNRYNRRKLRIAEPAVAALQVGGNFQALDVESFVAALERSFNLSATRSEDGTIVLTRAPAGAH